MFVFSVKSSKLKIALTAFAAVLAAAAIVLLINRGKPAVKDNAISLKASNASERTAFLSQFGWEVEEDPVEVAEVIIPAEFDRGYEKYNEIQKAQNLDLTPYAGKRAKRWTYSIKNYPGYEGADGTVQANILVYEGAGDRRRRLLDRAQRLHGGLRLPDKNRRAEPRALRDKISRGSRGSVNRGFDYIWLFSVLRYFLLRASRRR